MNRTIGFFLAVVGILLMPVLFWMFGPLIFWPVSRELLAADDKRIKVFQNIFFAHLVLVVGGSALVAISFFGGAQDAVYWLAVPYGFGIVFLIACVVVFFAGKGSKHDREA